jgi:hypothetical protein
MVLEESPKAYVCAVWFECSEKADKRQHPHLTPADTWKSLFGPANDPETKAMQEEAQGQHSLFTPSQEPGHMEILRLLRENDPDTITIAAIGPLTNLALAAAEDPETFLRVKEVVVMGGNVYEPGNVKSYPPPGNKGSDIVEPPFRLIKQAYETHSLTATR